MKITHMKMKEMTTSNPNGNNRSPESQQVHTLDKRKVVGSKEVVDNENVDDDNNDRRLSMGIL